MTGSLHGRVAIVTGGGRGLGRAIAAGLAKAGATTIITGRDAARAESAAEELSRDGAQVIGIRCDATDEAATERLAGTIRERWGAPHILVNNAGINPWYRTADKTPLDEWRAVIDTNLTAVFIGCRIFGSDMLAAGRGSIINVTSVAGHVGLPRTAAYCAAKGGVELMSKSIAIDWATRGVRVNCVAPGYFTTDLTEGLRDNANLAEMVTAHTPMRRFGDPEELAGACLYLASDAASFVTGQSFRIDGGFTAA